MSKSILAGAAVAFALLLVGAPFPDGFLQRQYHLPQLVWTANGSVPAAPRTAPV